MFTPTSLTINPSEECPQADHALFYYKTCHYLLQVGTHDFEGTNPLCSPLPGKAIKLSFSKWKWKLLSCVQLFATPWTVACQAPLFMEFLRILEWGAIPFSRESSQPRDRIQVSHISGRFFAIWATSRDPLLLHPNSISEIWFGTGVQRNSFQHHSQTYYIFPLVPAPHQT